MLNISSYDVYSVSLLTNPFCRQQILAHSCSNALKFQNKGN